jgi:hypothetical protein
MIDHRKNVVTIRNITFGTGKDMMTKYADVMAVRDYTICEVLFHGTLDQCHEFVDNGGYEHTAAPTTPFMPISRVLPGMKGSKAKFKPRTFRGRK